MPRGARLDTPGTLHHVMARGTEKRAIVVDDKDREFFVDRLGGIARATETKIYAWVLMGNHIHLLLKSSTDGLSTFMSRLLGSHASNFNKRYQRTGRLFENRFKSIVCEEERYFLKLIAYIHLNPLRAGLVKSIEDLANFPWCGHASLLGQKHYHWQEHRAVLELFGTTETEAQQRYLDFVAGEMKLGEQPTLLGGGMLRSDGGWAEVRSKRQREKQQFSDERILGSSDFVAKVISEAGAGVKNQLPALGNRNAAEKKVKSMCDREGVTISALMGGCRRKECTNIRKKLVLQFVLEMGISYADIARMLGISASAVNQIVRRERARRQE
ncbi:MAG: transposase [Chlorobium phaeovibrioides]|nr:transposase [Chlorobium phaeovibrioides]